MGRREGGPISLSLSLPRARALSRSPPLLFTDLYKSLKTFLSLSFSPPPTNQINQGQKMSDVSYTSLDDGHNTLRRGCLHHRAWLGVRSTVYVPPDGVDSDISHAIMVTPAGTAGHTDRAA
jgi:hypothetical protein